MPTASMTAGKRKNFIVSFISILPYFDWLLLALGRLASACATTTPHTAIHSLQMAMQFGPAISSLIWCSFFPQKSQDHRVVAFFMAAPVEPTAPPVA
jgi:hypothetical protein